jgi:hypothetical protein
MRAAASNPGGDAGAGIGMGMGFAMAKQIGEALGTEAAAPPAATPPPLPQERSFYIAKAGQQTGPFPLGEVRRQVQAGELTAASLVWSAGMANWASAGEVAELAPLFAATPPPLPPDHS